MKVNFKGVEIEIEDGAELECDGERLVVRPSKPKPIIGSRIANGTLSIDDIFGSLTAGRVGITSCQQCLHPDKKGLHTCGRYA